MRSTNDNFAANVDYWLEREAAARVLAETAPTQAARDRHAGIAERYADKAWSLAEGDPSAPYLATALWDFTRQPTARVSASG